MSTNLLFVHALSPLHAGAGRGLGVIDLPVARERSTGIPFLPASSVKGVLRDACDDPDTRVRLFGPETDKADEHAGSVMFSDARLLLFPVRSLAGTFAWLTSRYVLQRWSRDLALTALSSLPDELPDPNELNECLACSGNSLEVTPGQVVFEDLDLCSRQCEATRSWAEFISSKLFADEPDWKSLMMERFCVVHDDVLMFLLETATEISARIRLQSVTKTVTKGGLWYEEALPADTVLSAIVVVAPVRRSEWGIDQILEHLTPLVSAPMQLGGLATVGRGICNLTIV